MNTLTRNKRLKSAFYLLHQLRPYRAKMIFSILMGVLKEVCIISAVGICAYMAAIAIEGEKLSLYPWLWILAACVAGRCVATFFESYFSHDVAYHALVDYRVKL